jgi:hypothetical protein
MRNFVLVLLAAGGLAMIGAAPAQAVGTRYPFCIQGQDNPGLSNCTFTSYEQCQATASGRFLYCVENPYYKSWRTRSARLSQPPPGTVRLPVLLIARRAETPLRTSRANVN